MTADVEQQARPHDELICELLDSRLPKTEREHAAAREIEALRAEVAEQCRLHAIGMERELALITERDRLQAEVELLKKGIVPRNDDMIVPAKLLDEINASGAEWKDRAERLAEEVEALRAEVERSERYAEQSERERLWAEARAEHLAEALREAYRQVRELCDCYGHVYPEASFVRYEALLREQEEGNEQ